MIGYNFFASFPLLFLTHVHASLLYFNISLTCILATSNMYPWRFLYQISCELSNWMFCFYLLNVSHCFDLLRKSMPVKGKKSMKAFHFQNIHPKIAGNWWVAAFFKMYYYYFFLLSTSLSRYLLLTSHLSLCQ